MLFRTSWGAATTCSVAPEFKSYVVELELGQGLGTVCDGVELELGQGLGAVCDGVELELGQGLGAVCDGVEFELGQGTQL